MKWIDQAGYACAAGWARRHCVAVYVGGIRFHRPVALGALVEVEARLAFTGRTGMNISIEVRSSNTVGGPMQTTTECLTVFVAVDANGRHLPARAWHPATPGEIALAQGVRAQLAAYRSVLSSAEAI